MAGDNEQTPSSPGPADRQAEIFDEDHLEFEDLLLSLHKKTDQLAAQVRVLTQYVSDARAEALESHEMLENLQAKVDHLTSILAAWPGDRVE